MTTADPDKMTADQCRDWLAAREGFIKEIWPKPDGNGYQIMWTKPTLSGLGRSGMAKHPVGSTLEDAFAAILPGWWWNLYIGEIGVEMSGSRPHAVGEPPWKRVHVSSELYDEQKSRIECVLRFAVAVKVAEMGRL